jgi:hypothetical protein
MCVQVSRQITLQDNKVSLSSKKSRHNLIYIHFVQFQNVKRPKSLKRRLTPKRLKVPLRPVECNVFFLYLEWIHTFTGFEFNREVGI